MACASLGSASDFSIFLFGDYISNFQNLPGRVAAGGNITTLFQSVSSGLPVSTTRADLVVGGNFSISGGINNGNTVVSPTSVNLDYTMGNVNGVTPQPIIDTPVDFTATQSYLQCLSQGWASLTPNTAAERGPSDFLQLNFTDPVLNVVTFNGNDIYGDGSNFTLISMAAILINLSPGATVLINVLGDGPDIGFGNFNITINGENPPSDPTVGATIVWNFPEASTLSTGNGIFTGTMFAPFAAGIATGFCQVNGQYIAGSFDGTGGGLFTPNLLFSGCLPEVPACGVSALTVTKLVNGAATFSGIPGTPITFSMLVTNNSAVPVNNISIADPVLGIEQTVPVLNPGESFPFVVDSEVQFGRAGSQYSNTVTVTSDNAQSVSSTVTITIAALPVNVQFAKNASQTTADPGDQIVYTFSVANLGNTDLTNVRLTDPAIGLDLALETFFSGTLTLQTFTIPSGAVSGSTFTNTARLTADNLPNPGFLDSSASITITSPPAAGFRKLASVTNPLPGTTIRYSYVIQNVSDAALRSLILDDPSLNFVRTIELINPRTTVVLETPFTVPVDAAAGTTIVNTATLSGSFGTLSSSATVVVDALLSLIVTIDEDTAFVNPGGTIVYTLRVLNNGNISLANVLVTDELTGFQTVIPVLPAGESLDFNTSLVVPPGTPARSLVTNKAFAQADGVAPVSAEVSAVVTDVPIPPEPPTPPATPVIALGGGVSASTARPGETVTFTGTVTNVSAVTVRNLILRSPFFQYASVLELLEPGATLVLNADFAVPDDTAPGTVITATLSATSITIPLQEAAASFVVIQRAELDLSNTLNETEAVQGDTVIYTIVGDNTGNVPINDILFSDTALNQRTEIQTISPGTIITAFFSKTVTEEPGTTFCNEASVTASAIGTVSAVSCYTVFGLQLRKQANASIVTAGSAVHYSVIIRNPMPLLATGIVFRDPIPDLTELVPGSVKLGGMTVPDAQLAAGIPLAPLGPNDTATVTFSATVTGDPASGSIANRAEATFLFPSTARQLSGTSFSNTLQVAVEEHEE